MIETKIPEKYKRKLTKYAVMLNEAGCPSDQIKNFVHTGYIALPQIMPFHAAARACDRDNGPDQVGMGGTRGPGKSHGALAQVGLDDCQRYAGLKWLFLRKVKLSASEALEDLVYKVLRGVAFEYKPSAGRVDFPNGSRIILGGFNHEREIDKYLGLEYDGLVMEEATQISERKKDMIYGSIRTSRDDWRPRKYLTTNPDGVGLAWFKREFILPWREGRQKWTRFFPGDYEGNPYLNKEYIRYLENLKGPLAKAWRYGDWDAFEGMAFPNWDYDSHVVEPFTIPEDWYCWMGIDEGYAAPWACYWLARDPVTRHIYVYREAYQKGLTVRQQAQLIQDMTPENEIIQVRYADPAMFSRKNMEGRVLSSADEYANAGVPLVKADNDRIQGKRRFDQALAPMPDGEPELRVFRNCKHFIETVPLLILDDVRPEDVDTDMEDHAYDAVRYALTGYRLEREPKSGEQVNPWTRLGGIL